MKQHSHKTTRRAVAVILTVLMAMSCFSAAFGVISFAAAEGIPTRNDLDWFTSTNATLYGAEPWDGVTGKETIYSENFGTHWNTGSYTQDNFCTVDYPGQIYLNVGETLQAAGYMAHMTAHYGNKRDHRIMLNSIIWGETTRSGYNGIYDLIPDYGHQGTVTEGERIYLVTNNSSTDFDFANDAAGASNLPNSGEGYESANEKMIVWRVPYDDATVYNFDEYIFLTGTAAQAGTYTFGTSGINPLLICAQDWQAWSYFSSDAKVCKDDLTSSSVMDGQWNELRVNVTVYDKSDLAAVIAAIDAGTISADAAAVAEARAVLADREVTQAQINAALESVGGKMAQLILDNQPNYNAAAADTGLGTAANTFNAQAYHQGAATTGAYSNLVYSPIWSTSWSGVGGADAFIGVGRQDLKIAIPRNVVMVYDGVNDVYAPIEMETKCNQSSGDTQKIHYFGNYSSKFTLHSDWTGSSIVWDNWVPNAIETDDSFAYYDNNNYNETSQDMRNTGTSRFWYNKIWYEPSINPASSPNTDSYYDHETNLSYYGKTSYKETTGSRQPKYGDVTSKTDFYALNYQPVYSKLGDAADVKAIIEGDTAWQYTDASINRAKATIAAMIASNPNNFFNNNQKFVDNDYDADSAAVASAVGNCASAIKDAAHMLAHDGLTLVKKSGTATFYEEDGTTVVDTITADYGDTFMVPAVPAKASTAQYNYTNPAWDPAATPGSATMNDDYNKTFTATYTESTRSYSIIWSYQNTGGTQSTTTTVPYGETPVAPAEATGDYVIGRTQFTFDGWSPSVTAVTGTATYTATYTESELPAATATMYANDIYPGVYQNVISYTIYNLTTGSSFNGDNCGNGVVQYSESYDSHAGQTVYRKSWQANDTESRSTGILEVDRSKYDDIFGTGIYVKARFIAGAPNTDMARYGLELFDGTGSDKGALGDSAAQVTLTDSSGDTYTYTLCDSSGNPIGSAPYGSMTQPTAPGQHDSEWHIKGDAPAVGESVTLRVLAISTANAYSENLQMLSEWTDITITGVCTHSKGYTAETTDCLKTAATCQTAAVYYKSCPDCGASSQGTASEATFSYGDPDTENGHDWEFIGVEGNCTVMLTEKHVCRLCGAEKNVNLHMYGSHNYQFNSFVWTDDPVTAKAKYVCSNNNAHTQLYDATVTSEDFPATYATGAYTIYSATYTDGDVTYTGTKDYTIPVVTTNLAAAITAYTLTPAQAAQYTAESLAPLTTAIEAAQLLVDNAAATVTAEGKAALISQFEAARDAMATAFAGLNTRTFTVTWVVEGVTVETDENVLYGAKPSYDVETPTKEQTYDYNYQFAAWNPEITTETTVTADVTYTATFTPIARTDADYTAYNTALAAAEGVLAIAGLDPDVAEVIQGKIDTEIARAHDDQNRNYRSDDTAGVTDIATAVVNLNKIVTDYTDGNNNLKDEYKSKFTVTWVVEGVTVETDENVLYGATPSYDGETPTKAATAALTYTFDKWTPDLVPVTANATYTATFTETANYSADDITDAILEKLGEHVNADGSLPFGICYTEVTLNAYNTALETAQGFAGQPKTQENIDLFDDALEALLTAAQDLEVKHDYSGDPVLTRPVYNEDTETWSDGVYTWACENDGNHESKTETVARANYTKYNSVLEQITSLLEEDLTDDVKAALQTAKTAMEAIRQNYVVPEQSILDGLIQDILNTLNENDKITVDEDGNITVSDDAYNTYDVSFEELTTKKGEAVDIRALGGYTEATTRALNEAIALAETVLAKPNTGLLKGAAEALEGEVAEALEALNVAIELAAGENSAAALLAAKEELWEAIQQGNALDTTGVDEDLVGALTTALADGQTVYDDDDATLQEVKDATQDILDAILAIVKEQLEDKIDEAENLDTTGAAENHVTALEDAITNGENVLSNPDATIGDVTDAIEAIDNAIAAIEADKLAVAKDELLNAINQGNALDSTGVDEALVAALTTALADGQTVYDDDDATLQQVKDATQDILDAILAIVKEAAKDAIDEAAGEDPSDEVQTIVDHYDDLIDNATTPEEVEQLKEEAIAAIEAAQSAEPGPADYEEYDELYAILETLKDNDSILPELLEQVNDKYDNPLPRDLTEADQGIIDTEVEEIRAILDQILYSDGNGGYNDSIQESAMIHYNVTFYWLDTQLTKRVVKGGSTTAPDVTVMYGVEGMASGHYVFDSWDQDFTNVNADLEVHGSYRVEEHAGSWTLHPATCSHVEWQEIDCTICGMHFKKDTGTELAPHTFGEWVVVEPTCARPGSKTRTCTTDPSHKETEFLPQLDHVDANHDTICDVCGNPMPNHQHTDANGDNKCDTCGAPCDVHVHSDGNNDGVCDGCGRNLDGSFRCNMCPFYERTKGIPVFGWFIIVIHFFYHLICQIISWR